jgi:hypothetical protein
MGLSPRNLWDMKRFYEQYFQADPKLQRCVAVLPWRQEDIDSELKKKHDVGQKNNYSPNCY